MGVGLWMLVIYGWRRAASFSSSADILNSVWFVVAAVLANSILVSAFIWCRTNSFRRHGAQSDRSPRPASLQEVVS
jgi:hypothetical protein